MTLFILYRLFCLNYESKKLVKGSIKAFLDLNDPFELFENGLMRQKRMK